jgi:uncharacterized membrane protein YidH (DUF202 family)
MSHCCVQGRTPYTDSLTQSHALQYLDAGSTVVVLVAVGLVIVVMGIVATRRCACGTRPCRYHAGRHSVLVVGVALMLVDVLVVLVLVIVLVVGVRTRARCW